MKTNKEVTILGRGESLKKLDKFESGCTDVILVNEHWKSPRNPCDYYKVPEISKFITGKQITLVCTPCLTDLNPLIKGIESDHKVKNKYNTVFAPGSGTDRDRPANGGWNCFPSECIEDYKYAHLSGKLKQQDSFPGVWPLGCVRGSLAWSIMLAINYYNADKINIFGLDFYEKEYLVQQKHDYEIEKKQCQSIKDDYSLLFKFYNRIEFSIYTLASYNPDLKNVKIF